MADTPAEIKGFVGRTEDAIDAKVTGDEMSILGANGLAESSFNSHFHCKISMKCGEVVPKSHAMNSGI